MFDPLSGALAYLLTEGIKKLSVFLKETLGLNIEVESWASLFVAAVVSGLLVYFNVLGGKLPTDVAALVPFAVKVVLVLLEAVGIHSAVNKVAQFAK